MKILGLDISSSSTGWSILDADSGDLVGRDPLSCGSIRMKQKTHGERLVVLEAKLKEVIKQYQPDLVVFEAVFVGFRNPKTAMLLSMYHGVCRKVVWQLLKKEPETLTVSDIRKVVGAHNGGINLNPGKAEKERTGKDGKHLTFQCIKALYGLSTWEFGKMNDAADALAVSLAYKLILDGSLSVVLNEKTNKKNKKQNEKATIYMRV